jgi:hypothetical protein
MKWNGMEWLSYDYGNGGVMDISAEWNGVMHANIIG